MKKLLALLLLLTKSTFLVLMSSMSFWGMNAMAMSMPDCDKVMDGGMGCAICEIAEAKWSEPFLARTKVVESHADMIAIVPPFFTLKPKTRVDFRVEPSPIVFWEYQEINLTIKKKIVLII